MGKITKDDEIVIIGGGPAGILTAEQLGRFGTKALILEKNRTGESWRRMKDGMVMLSPSVASHDLTSLTYDNPIWSSVKLNGPFATKEQFVDYLENFVETEGISVMENQSVTHIGKEGGGFRVETKEGRTFKPSVVVVATGVIGNPSLPDIEGIDDNPWVVHSSSYKGFEAYRGKRVLVVGAGNSGAELTVELSGVAKVTFVSRGKLKYYSKTRNLSHIRGLSESLLKELIYFKIIEMKEGVEVTGIDRGRCRFSDSTEGDFDEIIFATGYKPYLPEFIDLPLKMTKKGYPRVTASCESISVKGLYFTGPLAQNNRFCAFIHCFRPMVEPMALHIAEKFGN